MATYTAGQLKGAGTPTEEISAAQSFVLTNPNKGSAYFTMETVRNANGYYDSTSPTNAAADYESFSGIEPKTLITSSYIFSVVVPSGGGQFIFTPDTTIAISSSMLRATGDVTLSIE